MTSHLSRADEDRRALLAALAWAARLALPRAGDHHMAGRQASAVVAGPQGPWFATGAGRLARAARALHAVVLRRDVASGNQAALMLHAMGAGRHAGGGPCCWRWCQRRWCWARWRVAWWIVT